MLPVNRLTISLLLASADTEQDGTMENRDAENSESILNNKGEIAHK